MEWIYVLKNSLFTELLNHEFNFQNDDARW